MRAHFSQNLGYSQSLLIWYHFDQHELTDFVNAQNLVFTLPFKKVN